MVVAMKRMYHMMEDRETGGNQVEGREAATVTEVLAQELSLLIIPHGKTREKMFESTEMCGFRQATCALRVMGSWNNYRIRDSAVLFSPTYSHSSQWVSEALFLESFGSDYYLVWASLPKKYVDDRTPDFALFMGLGT